jgi:hypothetical protein
MVLINDKIGTFKVIELVTTGDAFTDLAYLIEQDNAFFWDLDQSLSLLFAELPEEVCKALYLHGKALWRGWDLFYIPEKIFCVSYDYGKNFKYYNLAQFFPDIENPGIDIAQRCADELEHALHLMGIWPNKMSSHATIFEEYYGKHLDLPTYKHFMPEYSGLLEYAADCAGNEMTEIYKMGHWDKAYSYDRISAYGNEMANLVDNRPDYNTIRESSEYQEDADFGYCKCDVEIFSKTLVHPIMKIESNGELSMKVGTWRGKYTKAQLDFIKKWGIGDYEIVNGWWLKTKKVVKPLAQVIPRFLAFKEHGNPLVRELTKRMVNGFGGKLNEEYKERVGDLYNPMWSAEIITRNAMRICETIYRNKCWNDLISIKVDDFKLAKQLPSIPDGFKESSGECLAISADNVFYNNQHPNGLNLQEAMAMLTEHPNIGYHEKKIPKLITLKEAYQMKRPKDIGKEKTLVVSLDLFRNSVNRDFEAIPLNGHSLLNNVINSKPIFIEEA